jgi:hypothetical protein
MPDLHAVDPPVSDLPVVPARLPEADIARQAQDVAGEATLQAVLEAFPGPAVLLNDRRQVVMANRDFRAAASDFALGKRPGDCLGCVEAARAPDGCGTAPACTTCGAGRSLARLEQGDPSPIREECLLTRQGSTGEESLEFEAGLTRLPGGWTMMALRDLSGEKRRRVMERCFLHDALNAAGGVQGLAELAAKGDETMSDLLPTAAAAVVEELRHHQTLLAAESGELEPVLRRVDLAAICTEMATFYAKHPVGLSRRITVACEQLHVIADRVLLRRVVGNLLKNALEASRPGGVVGLSATRSGGQALVAVRNQGEMPLEVRHQVFRRYFSTKAASGRGIGTWSVKLLTERYLGGTVSFRCQDGNTIFEAVFPVA